MLPNIIPAGLFGKTFMNLYGNLKKLKIAKNSTKLEKYATGFQGSL